MTVDEAIDRACAEVGIVPPKVRSLGRWLKTDTLSGRSGRGDGRLMINDANVTGWNWQTGATATVWTKDASSPIVKQQMRQQAAKNAQDIKRRSEQAATIATRLIGAASLQTHAYLARKGFPEEQVLVIPSASVAVIAGKYLVPDVGGDAIIIPARVGTEVKSAQIIWEDGTKKFLFGGETAGASHRVAMGRDCWHCEGFATALSLRAAFQGIRYAATIRSCFSAGNVETVARWSQGRTFIAADHDKPHEQFGGIGAGEYYARRSGAPFLLPPAIGDDLNDMHQRDGIFAVQQLVCDFLKAART